MRKSFITILAVLALTFVAGVSGAVAQTVDKDFQEKVHMVLREHPEILVEALKGQSDELLKLLEQAARERQAKEEEAQLKEDLKNPRKPALADKMAMIGPKDAPITIVEYSDFFCHYCALASKTVKELAAEYPKKVRVVFKHMASKPISKKAALYFEAINLQDPKKAWQFHDAVFADQDNVSFGGETAMKKIAASLGVDMEKLAKDVDNKELKARLDADLAEARGFGFQGTPMFLVNGVTIRGAEPKANFEEVIKLVEEKDAKAKPSGPKIVEGAPK